MRILVVVAVCLQLLAPLAASAQSALKDPLNYPLKQYGFMLATAVLGGLVSWYAKLRKGEVSAWGVNHLVGELATSAFAGLICFWGCEAMGLQPIWTAPLVGVAGHMGTRAITAFEEFAQRRWAPKE